jgi:hypothetical protein
MGPEAGKTLLASVPDSWGLWIVGEPDTERLVEWDWQHSAGDCDRQISVATPQKEQVDEAR